MFTLDLTDCLRATPSGTLAAMMRELSCRARRSLGWSSEAEEQLGHSDNEIVPAWTAAVQTLSDRRVIGFRC